MKKLLSGIVLFGICTLGLADDRTIIIPRDLQPFTVEKSDIVRLTAKGIAGSKITMKITGPAKVLNVNNIFEREGGHDLVGNTTREYELQPTGTGKVTAVITIIPPQPGTQPFVKRYQFEVK